MPKTDGARVVADLRRLAEFGRYKTGVHRPTYSPEDVASRQWLAEKFAEAGLDPVIDGIGNVFGRNPRASRALLVGSHSETQPHGGWLDGALGVIYALEAARALPPIRRSTGVGVEAVAWADEEGHYGNMLGSRSFTGTLSDDEIDARHEPRRQDAARRAGRRPALPGGRAIALDPARYLGYFEAHIEQGDTLEATGLRIGVVEAIIGNLELLGHRHRRAEPCRHDRRCIAARMPAPRWCGWPRASTTAFAEIAGPRTVWTIGRMLIDPNAPSIVPGRAEMQVQFRDTDTDVLGAFESALHELVAEADRAGPCARRSTPISNSEPARWTRLSAR